MPFVYRLQKVLEFRIRKKEEQLLIVQSVQQELYEAQERIRKNLEEIEQIKINQRTADFSMLEAYDKYLHHLWEKAETLENEKVEIEERLKVELQKLVELEQAVKVLEKHKENAREVYLAEEKAAELKKYSELGVVRHFQQTKDRQEEEEELLKKLKKRD